MPVLAGVILGAALVIAVLMFAQIGQSAISKDRYYLGSSVVALLIVGAVVTIVIDTRSIDQPGRNDSETGTSSLTNMGRIDASLRRSSGSGPGTQQTTSVAPVPSLLSGLIQRLEENPTDGRGWALLAQSYAFVGQMDLAEEALLRAVELGLNEADLRSRVDSAQRNPHAGLSGVALAQALAQ